MNRKISNILEYINRTNTIILDGAMGTNLMKNGVHFDELKISNKKYPSLVQNVHREYLSNGSNIILTNTFNVLNREFMCEYFGSEKDGEKVQYENIISGIFNAKHVLSKYNEAFMAYNISPIWDSVNNENLDCELVKRIYVKLLNSIKNLNVDVFMLETFWDINMVFDTIKILNDYSDIPIIISLVYSENINKNIDLILKTFKSYKNIIAVGFNCFSLNIDFTGMTKTILSYGFDVTLKPNMGLSEILDNSIFYNVDIDAVKIFTEKSIKSGVKFIGACCGSDKNVICEMSKIAIKYNKKDIRD